jgi:hypothetical protein
MQFIIIRNPPHNAIKWPELGAFFMIINYIVELFLLASRACISDLINNSFVYIKQLFKQKLALAIFFVHLSADF